MTDTTRALNSENDFVEKFNNVPEFRKYVNEALGSDYSSVSKAPYAPVTPFWRDVTGKNGGEVPKSDYVFDGTHGASFKNGPGRATSSNYLETKAIFDSVLRTNEEFRKNENLVAKLEEFFSLWKTCSVPLLVPRDVTTTAVKKGEAHAPELLRYVTITRELTTMVRSLREDYREFMLAVIRETLTGENKFGDQYQSPKYYIRCATGNIEDLKLATSVNSKEFSKECEKYLDSPKLNVAMKTASSGEFRRCWVRFM